MGSPRRVAASDVGHPLAGAAVPSLDDRRAALQGGGTDAGDGRGVVAEQDVGAVGDRHRALGVAAQREARDAQHRGLLLHAAGVRHDRRGADLEAEEVEVARRVQAAHARGLEAGHEPVGPQALHRARMDGEDDGHGRGQRRERRDDAPQLAAARRRWTGGAG